MSEEKIYSIIDDIAHDAKVIIAEHLHPESVELVDALNQSAKEWDEAGEKMSRVFRDLEDDVRAYFEKNHDRIVDVINSTKCEDRKEYSIGDDVYFIGGGSVVKDRVKDVKLYTEGGKWISLDEAFRSLDELVEHLKKSVNG